MPTIPTISATVSGTITVRFDSIDDLQRLLSVLDAGLENNSLFNDDIVDFADVIRSVVECKLFTTGD